MADLQPLVQKIQTAEQITLEDWENLLDAYRDAMSDGRITVREGLRLAFSIIAILREFVEKPTTSTDVNFGF